MIKRIVLPLLLIGCFLLVSSLSVQAKDILGPPAQCGTPGLSNSAVCTEHNTTSNPIIGTLKNIALIVAFVAGAAAILLLLVGSLQYITSGGDPTKVSSAKNTIIYALVGLVVVALAATIIEFVLNKL